MRADLRVYQAAPQSILLYLEHSACMDIMDFNESNLVKRVSALAHGQLPEWKANALRALGNENTLVQRCFLDERDDGVAIIFMDRLIKCAYWYMYAVFFAQCPQVVNDAVPPCLCSGCRKKLR